MQLAKKDIRRCRYCDCKHESKDIDTSIEPFVVKNSMYFHEDCYKKKSDGEWKTQEQKNDLQLIKTLWADNISNTVNYSQLFSILNEFLGRGIESKYLVFVIEYCISHHYSLNYPNGIKYFIDRQEIKDAYAQHKAKKIIKEAKSKAETKPNPIDDSPKFEVKHLKKQGFGNLFE